MPSHRKYTLLALLGVGAVLSSTRPARAVEIYVSPSGRDTASGSAGQPLRTLEAARDAVRKLTGGKASAEPVTVVLQAGVYQLERPFTLSPEDSGSEAGPITYRAAEPGKVLLSGGRTLEGWQPGQGKLWQVEIPEVRQGKWYFHQLFVNGQRRRRARTPNTGFLRTEGPAVAYKHDQEAAKGMPEIRREFKFKPGDLDPKWRNLDDVNVFLYHSWTNSLHWIEAVDAAKGVVRLKNPSAYPVSWWERQQRYYVENARETLDAPGEWYLDRQTGLLEYWSLSGEDMAKAKVVAPVLEQLVKIEGLWEEGRVVHDVTFHGLRLQHADWAFVDRSRMLDGQSGNFLPGAIQVRGAARITLDHCEVAHVGTYGIWLESGCQHCRIVHCEIHDLGAGGVRVGETVRQKARSKGGLAKGPALAKPGFDGNAPGDTGRNTIDNNFIHDGGHVFAAGTGVFLGHSGFNQITHNEISDLYYSGVGVGWVWGFAASAAHHNRIADNHIHHLGWGVLSDMGGVYTLGPAPGTVVAHNHVHHVCSYSYGGWGLYTDEGSTGVVLENNLVHDTKTGGFHQHYGRDNLIRNNIFAFSCEGQIRRSREDLPCSVDFQRNIVYCDNAQVLAGVWRNGDYKLDHNVYWTTAKAEPVFDHRNFAQWRATSGQDAHSILADPRFVNAAGRDFRLLPDSPALKLGFRPIDLAGMGLYGEAEWVAAPQKVVRGEFVLPPAGGKHSLRLTGGRQIADCPSGIAPPWIIMSIAAEAWPALRSTSAKARDTSCGTKPAVLYLDNIKLNY